jgi:hypothetical protein
MAPDNGQASGLLTMARDGDPHADQPAPEANAGTVAIALRGGLAALPAVPVSSSMVHPSLGSEGLGLAAKVADVFVDDHLL